MHWPFLRVFVAGDSMVPALRPADYLLVRCTRRVRSGDVVVLRRPDRPGLIVVKRAVRRTDAGWWVEGDNPTRSDDSRLFGPVGDDYLIGRAMWRYWPLFRGRAVTARPRS